MTPSIKRLSLTVVFIFIFAPAVHAHKVTIFAWAEGDTVYTESKFSGGKRVKGGKVEVFEGDGSRLLEGRTDENGEFFFKVRKITDLNIVLTAGMGHRSSWRLSAAELGANAADGAAKEKNPPVPPVSQTFSEPVPPVASPCLTAREVEAIVARQLEQKLRPLTRMVAAARDKGPSVSDIFGGIGYIIGLVGLSAYVRHRKESRRQ